VFLYIYSVFISINILENKDLINKTAIIIYVDKYNLTFGRKVLFSKK
jgi:hypothetical protein